MQAQIAKTELISEECKHHAKIYFAGCDLNCPNCNTQEMLIATEEHTMELKDLKNILRGQQQDGVIFTGGEPCLQRQAIISIAGFSKDMKLGTVLETNGTKTECIRSLLRLSLLDAIVMDMKAPLEPEPFEKATRSKTFFKTTESLITDIKRTLRLLKENQNSIKIEFRTTITPNLISRKEDLYKIAEEIQDIECIWSLQQFRPENTSRRYREINPPSEEFLFNLKEAVTGAYPNIRIFVEPGLS